MRKDLSREKKEYIEKTSLKKKLDRYYGKQSTKNGLKPVDMISKYTPEEFKFLQLRRKIIVAHLDFEKILVEMTKGSEFTVVSGLNPSSGLHYGHKLLFDLLLELQNLGGNVYIPLTNDETYLDGKVKSLEKSKETALKKIIPSIVAFGFKPSKTHIYIDTEYPDLYKFAIKISKFVSMSEVEKLFGREALSNPGQVFYRGCVQLAETLMPQLPEFGGPKITLIPVGIDQHPYILLARDIAKKLGMVPPAELVIKFQPSLKNPEDKMSKSNPSSAIFLSDSSSEIKNKIQKAYTGSVSSKLGHQKLGAVPEICPVFQLINSQSTDDGFVSDLYEKYSKGNILTIELKEIVAKELIKINSEHKKILFGKDLKSLEKFLLNKKLESVYNP